MDYNDSLYCQTNSTATVMNGKLFYRNTTISDTVYGADPSVMEITKSGDKNQGKYLMMVTGNSDKQSIPVYISSDLTNWKKSGTIELKDENGSAATTAANADIWAMEMVYDEDKDKYYLFFSATPEKSEGSTVCEVPYVAVGDSYTGMFQLINHADYKYADGSSLDSKEGNDALGYASSLKYSVFDPYQMGQALKKTGLVSDPSAKAFRAIDFHPFIDSDGEKYLYFSITSVANKQVILGIQVADWITPKYDTLTVLTENKKDAVGSSTTVAYERNYTNEGPWMTSHKGKYYLTLSINGYGKDNYKVIQAVSDSPLGAFRKLTVEEGGILLGADRIGEISGPGHHSLVEKNGEIYIVYHVHNDPANPSYSRHVVMDKVEWVTNKNELEVMYVNGPTKASVQPLPEFASGYKNIAADASVTSDTVKSDSAISYLTDKLWNTKGSTWKGENSGTDVVFGDSCAKETEFDGKATIIMNFEETRTIRALMVYNSSDVGHAFDNIERIEFTCADGTVKYINNLGFDTNANTYTFADYQGITTGDEKYLCGASIAEFCEMDVTAIKIIVNPAGDNSEVALSEIVVLGK